MVGFIGLSFINIDGSVQPANADKDGSGEKKNHQGSVVFLF